MTLESEIEIVEDVFGAPQDRHLTEIQEQRLVVLHTQLLADKEKLCLEMIEEELSDDGYMKGLDALLDEFRSSLLTQEILTEDEIEDFLGPDQPKPDTSGPDEGKET